VVTADHYKFDLREIKFLLLEQFPLATLTKHPKYEHFTWDTTEAVLEECIRFSQEVLAPLNASGDREGCTLTHDGKVITPKGFKEAWEQFYESGWNMISVSEEEDGMGAPATFVVTTNELFSGANTAFYMYPGLASGVQEVIEAVGTKEQKETFLPGLRDGRYGGTMCLTEPQAGSDVGFSKSTAVPHEDSYLIEGTKIFISSGDQDITENVIHLALARLPDAPAGTKGLSLFIVPKYRLNKDGSVGEFNDVKVGGVEEKMGIHGNATCVLNFGEDGNCKGYLIGAANGGMKEMFRLMNYARIFTGVQGVSVASTAYLNALAYSRSRMQGPKIDSFGDGNAPRQAIIAHADVRRMLLEMKSKVETMRALCYKLAMHWDISLCVDPESEEHTYHKGQLDLLTPVVKAFCTDQSFRVCELAIQTYGGYGYISDYPVEQYMRDAKVFSIYEGTNFIQSLDLVGRKLRQRGGANLMDFSADISKFCGAHENHEIFKAEVAELETASNQLTGASMALMGFAGKDLNLVALFATRYLELVGEVACAWLGMEAAIIAHNKLKTLAEDDGDRSFYEGKIASAKYYVNNILPGVAVKCAILSKGDDTANTCSDKIFSTEH
jgi:alkylation response protein AidB-like acyl-CoA dehydrogenase